MNVVTKFDTGDIAYYIDANFKVNNSRITEIIISKTWDGIPAKISYRIGTDVREESEISDTKSNLLLKL